jgi:metal-responsive CopG/Arc/MetJ family transcriptional regulator
MPRARPVQISLDEDLLARVDEDSEARIHGRSAFMRSAIRRYLREKEEARIDDALRAAYRGHADDALEDVELLIEGQAWPDE